MNVRDIMTTEVITVKPDMDLHSLAELFLKKDISGAPVLDDQGRFLGIVLEEGLIVRDKKVHLPMFLFVLLGFVTVGEERFEEDLKKKAATTVLGIMEQEINALSPDTPVEDAATMIIEKGIHYFPVLDNARLVGVVTRKDIVRAIAEGKIA